MAKVTAGAPPAAAPPAPPTGLNGLVTRMTWPVANVIHRIHPDIYAADQFNPGPNGNARFSPIKDAAGNSIPTIYGGTDFECAAMETVFHDVPFAPGFKSHDKAKLGGHLYSQVLTSQDLVLADLGNLALRKLGVTRVQLIETEKDEYTYTRTWAEAIHAQCADIQGLCWVSRQHDKALAVVLFGDRLGSGPLAIHAPSVDIVQDPATYASVIGLADKIGVRIYGK